MEGADREQNLWWKTGLALVGPFYAATFRMRVTGTRNIPREGLGILAANHISVMDPPVLALMAARRGRSIHFLATHQLFDIIWIGWALRATGQIPLRRGEQDSAAIDEAARVISSGRLGGIFPEGRVGEDPNELQRGHRGVARLSLASGAPVIPVGIWGTQLRWPHPGLRLGRPLRPRLAISVGEPIPAQGDSTSMDDIQSFLEIVMRRIGEERTHAREAASEA